MNNLYFVYTGNAYPHKNLPRLFEAIKLLNTERKEKIELRISSSRNIFTQRLEKEIKKQNLGRLIKLLGYVKDEEINSLYKNSIAFVFPTLSEGFGLPPMEAINAGTLALVSDIPVLKEVYEDSVTYFDPYDVISIKNSLRKALNLSEAERTKKINDAKAHIKKYSWQKMAKETLKIYESVV